MRFTEDMLTKSSTATRLGIDNRIAPEHKRNAQRLIGLLDTIESIFGKRITLTSAYRSPALNKAVGGSLTSAHSRCLAADFEVPGVTNLTACALLASGLTRMGVDYDQIIYEFGPEGWVHIGLSEGPGRKHHLSAVKKDGRTVYSPGFSA